MNQNARGRKSNYSAARKRPWIILSASHFTARSPTVAPNQSSRRNLRAAHDHGAFLDRQAGRLDPAKKTGRGFQRYRLLGAQIGHQFAADLRGYDGNGLAPMKTAAHRDNLPRGRKVPLDLRPRMDFQGALGRPLPQQPPLEDAFAGDRVRVEEKASGFDQEAAFGPEVFGNGVGNLVVPQIHVAAAPLAHGGLRRERHFQFRRAFETGDASGLTRRRLRPRGRTEDLLHAKVLVALLANGGVGARRFGLGVPALRTSYRYLARLHRWPLADPTRRQRLFSVRLLWPVRRSWGLQAVAVAWKEPLCWDSPRSCRQRSPLPQWPISWRECRRTLRPSI